MKKNLTITSIILSFILIVTCASNASAAWTYYNYSIPYNVTAPTNLPPVVDAGPDKTMTQPANSVSVTGTATDPDGTIASTQWTKISGPATYSIVSPASLTTLMDTLNTPGVYVFQLSATDNQGLSASDTMQITVAAPATYPDLVAGGVSPVSVIVGASTTLQSTITNQGSASTGSSFNNFFQVASGANGSGTITDLAPSPMNTLSAGSSAQASRTYIFSSIGTQSVRACADKSSSGNTGSISESNENNNCGPWTNISIASNIQNGICSGAHYSCVSGTSVSQHDGTSSWTWSCTGSNGGVTASCQESKSTVYQCSDGIDNDNDGKIDYKGEPTASPVGEGDIGCTNGQDNDERNIKPIYIER
jgi:hypothetical protein